MHHRFQSGENYPAQTAAGLAMPHVAHDLTDIAAQRDFDRVQHAQPPTEGFEAKQERGPRAQELASAPEDRQQPIERLRCVALSMMRVAIRGHHEGVPRDCEALSAGQ